MSTLKFKVTSSDAYKSVDDYTKLAIDIDLDPKLIRLVILNSAM